MNFVSFAIKRAYWSDLKAFRGAFRYFGLTAARFDILFAIGHGNYTQADVARQLGVCRSTVCRLVQKLEKLGLVARCDAKKDGRRFSVGLLFAGHDALVELDGTLLRKRILLKTHGAAFHHDHDRDRAYDTLESVGGNAKAIAAHFGDRAFLPYPTYYPEI
jgi:DNA-binding MarR family transcriptional regulator